MTTTENDIGQPVHDVDKPDVDDLELTSVTTVIGVLDKPALLYWAAGETASAAINSLDTWQAMLKDEGEDAAWTWLRAAMNRRPKNMLSNAALGTIVHTLCEQYALTGERPTSDVIDALIITAGGMNVDVPRERATAMQMLDRFDEFLQRFTPEYAATEVCVYSPQYGYAGQLDAICTIGGVRVVVDYKTSREPYDRQGKPKTPYPDQVALQLAAYRHADMAAVWRARRFERFRRRYYLLSAAEQAQAVAVPEVDTGLVIHITPEACEGFPMRCDEEVHHYFLNTLEAFRWVNEDSKTVMGKPLT